MRRVSLVVACALLSACGGGGSDGAGGSEAVSEASGNDTATAAVTPSDAAKVKAWLAAPCTMVGNEAVGTAMGTTVDRASPIPAKDGNDADASCNYGLADGGFVNTDITYREGYYDAGEIDSRRQILAGDKPVEEVPGVGDAAFWVNKPKNMQLYVYRGGAEQALFGPSAPKSGDAKAAAIAMAKAAGY